MSAMTSTASRVKGLRWGWKSVDFSSSSVSVSEGGGGGASSAGFDLRSLLKIPILWRIEEVGDEDGDEKMGE